MEISALFRSKGLKVTPQRRVVYNVLRELCHASVEQIVEQVTNQNPSISVATVYNILDCFASSNIISPLSTTQGKLFYDITPTDHHHLVVDRSSIVDYQNEELNKLLQSHFQSNPINGMQIDKMSLQIYVTSQNH